MTFDERVAAIKWERREWLNKARENCEPKILLYRIVTFMNSITKFYAKDEIGFDLVDAWLMPPLLYLNWHKMPADTLEWVRRRLLRYEKQLRAFGLNYERLEAAKFSDRAVFFDRELTDAKPVLLTVHMRGNEKFASIAIHFRLRSIRKQMTGYATLPREDALAALNQSCLLKGFDNGSIDSLTVGLDGKNAEVFLEKALGGLPS